MKREQESTIWVRGMTCGACARHVKEALADVDGVNDVEVHMREGRVVVKHETSVTALTEAVRQAGYEAESRPAEAA